MELKDFFKTLIEKITTDIKAKQLQMEKQRNDALATNIFTEVYNMLTFSHLNLVELGITEDIRPIAFKDNMLTIGIPKIDSFRDYAPGDTRKICERLNQLLVKFLQYEYNRLGPIDYHFCYPTIPRAKFLTVVDHSVELVVTLRLM